MSEGVKRARSAARHCSILVRRALRMIASYEGPLFQDKSVKKKAMYIIRCVNHAQTFLHDQEAVQFENLDIETKRTVFR